MKIAIIYFKAEAIETERKQLRNELSDIVEFKELEWMQKSIEQNPWIMMVIGGLISTLLSHYTDPILSRFDKAIKSFRKKVSPKIPFFLTICISHKTGFYKVIVEGWEDSITNLLRRKTELEKNLAEYISTNSEISDRPLVYENEEDAMLSVPICTARYDSKENIFVFE